MDHLPAHMHVDDVDDLTDARFLAALVERDHPHVVRRELKRPVPLTALPEQARDVRSLDLGSRRHVVAEVDGAVVHVQSWKTSADITASAADPAVALAVVEEIRSRVPLGTADGKVDVVFTDGTAGCRRSNNDHPTVTVTLFALNSRLHPPVRRAARAR